MLDPLSGVPEAQVEGEPPDAVWDISSSCAVEADALDADDPAAAETAGFFEENLKGKINQQFTATYAMPFLATVTCTSNCPP